MALLKTALTELLGIEHPIMLAPMGSAAGGRLAAAVTQAGGLGLVGSGYANEASLRKELTEAGNIPVGVGFITWALDQRPAVLDVALAAKPRAVMLSFGDPAPYIGRIHAAGVHVICQVQTLEEARQAAREGADVIIAQGRDAGGHSGTTRGTMGFVPAVVDIAGSIPVVAAGGIADGRGLAAALVLGAAGVLMGTRFAVSRESLWTGVMKQGAVAAGADQTMQTRVFDIVRGAPWPERYPGRAVRNVFSARWHGHEDTLAADRPMAEAAYEAVGEDDLSQRVLWAGEGVDLITDVPPAAAIIGQVVAEAVAALRRAMTLAGAGAGAG